MTEPNELQHWVAGLDRRLYAALIGAGVGLLGALLGLLVALGGPLIAFGAVLGALVALYVITNVSAALYAVILIMTWLPFGTMPFRLGLTPTLLEVALGAFLVVYAFGWMSGRRRAPALTPIHALIAAYMLWLVFAFAMGLRFAMPTTTILRDFVVVLLIIGTTFVLCDLLRDAATLRRLVLVVMVAVGVQAVVAIALYALPDPAAERTLIRLARLGYPNGGVIRYIEDNPALADRAIGTWVDPNALGGVLALGASMIAPQLFARRPVLRNRWITFAVVGTVGLALLLTFSRASMLAFVVGLVFISLFRGYRGFLPLLLAGALLLVALPQTRAYIERFADAFTASDLATQMRIGEYTDSLRLIQRYPVFGVGFTGTPDIDLYTDVASMYLMMANQIGLVGVGLFVITVAGVIGYGLYSRTAAAHNPDLDPIHLGYHAALVTAMINGAADLYFFRTDFQASIMLFWLVVALALASSRLALGSAESTVEKPPLFR